MNAVHEMLDAVRSGNIEKVRTLIAADGELVNALDDTGDSALLLSLYYAQPEITKLLLARSPRINFFEAAAIGDTARLWDLLKHYPELVLSYSHDGFTALHLAAFFGRADVVELLLENHADIHAVANNQTFAPHATPLHSAVARGDAHVVALLLNAGADANAKQHGGYTALHAAVTAGNEDVVKLLLRHGADVRLRSDDGRTPQSIAEEQQNTAILELLRHH